MGAYNCSHKERAISFMVQLFVGALRFDVRPQEPNLMANLEFRHGTAFICSFVAFLGPLECCLDFCNYFSEFSGSIVGYRRPCGFQAQGNYWGTSINNLERRVTGCIALGVIMSKFCEHQPICPVSMPVIDESPEISFQPLV
jgi:hypothetical protein